MIYTHLINMPLSINELVHETIDNDYVVFINENLDSAGQLKAYQHALEHINGHDFDKLASADQIEYERKGFK